MTDKEEHTHHVGPLCEGWDEFQPHPGERCDHGSCWEIVHEDCQACFIEVMEGIEAEDRRRGQSYLARGLCPDDMTPVVLLGPFGAPGKGYAAECWLGHPYAVVDGSVHLYEDEAHAMTMWDVV